MTDPQSHVAAALPTQSPQEKITHMLTGLWSAQAVATAARLGIADALENAQPQDGEALARTIGADPAALNRLLRALASLGVLSQPQPDTYALTPMGEALRSDVPGSMRDFLIAETDVPHWQAWGKLHESVRSGQPVAPRLVGMPIFEYYASHPEEGTVFSRAMGNYSGMAAQGTVQNYDFSGARHIVDVGGAHGDMLLAILQANPHARGTVFDQPPVAKAAREVIAAQGYHERCKAVGGDFFQAVPQGGDLYLLKFILHDWQDPEALRILHNCREAITPDGRLLVIEMVVPDDNDPSPAQLIDLNMLVMTGGLERTASEYEALLSRAGFRLDRLTPTGSPYHLVEAVVA
ncbi:MAG: methyltransferase [Desulfobacter sp.]